MMNMQGSTMMQHPPTSGGSMILPHQQHPPPPPPPQQQQQTNNTGMMVHPSPPIHHYPPRPEDSALYITVSNPVQHSDGLNKYTTYDVMVYPHSNDNVIVGAAGNTSTLPTSIVSRRYSDFVWLYDKFHTDRPGAIVPPLPEKQPVGRFTPSFIEERRFQLERFVRRVVIHPELYDCACLETFLTASDSIFQMAKQNKTSTTNTSSNTNMSASTMMNGSFMHQQQQQPFGAQSMMGGMSTTTSTSTSSGGGGGGEGLKRWFAEKKTTLSGDLVKSPDDDLFEEIQRYITGLDTQMRTVSQQASGLVRKGKEIANGLFEFGLAFQLLGQSEADVLGGALLCMGDTADKLSVLAAEQAERELLQFEEPLQDYIKTIHAVQLALKRRQDKRITYSTCLSDIESKQNQFYKIRSQLGSEKKAYELEISVRRAQETADIARDEFVSCSQRVLREVDRFKREKAEGMRRTVYDYITIQVEYNKRMEEIWAALIPELEKVPPTTAMAAAMDHPSTTMTNVSTGPPETTILQPQPALYYGQPPPLPPSTATAATAVPSQQPQSHPQQPPLMQQQQYPVPSHNNNNNMDPSSMISVQYRDA